jgi:hypothetical protein
VPFDDAEAIASLIEALNAEIPPARRFGGMRIAEQVARIHHVRIGIYADEHPPPHFHAAAGDESASYRLDNGKLHEGEHSRRLNRAVANWYPLNRAKLIEV